jgi:glycosyltransferase involved in cell wall biosynthesis
VVPWLSGSSSAMSQAIRVVHVIARMNVGGPAVLISDTVRELDREEFDVRLITGNCGDDEADYLETQAPDIRAIRIDGLGRSVSPVNDVMALRSVVGRLRDIQPHIIHTHTAKAGVVGRLAARLAPIEARVVHTFHGHLLHGYFSPVKTRGLIAAEARLARSSDRLIAVSPQVRDDLRTAGIGHQKQYEVIPPGVSLGDLPDRESARAALHIPSENHVVLLLGRITRIKRPDRFAEAARIVHQQIPNTHFLIAGSGDLDADLRESMVGLPSSLLGWRSDVESLLAASDALVVTSDNEGTPLSVIQAGLAGVPTVGTRVGGMESVIDPGQTGLLVDPDARAVADGLVTLLERQPLRSAMGAEARRQMNAKFSTQAMIESHADLYRRMLEM